MDAIAEMPSRTESKDYEFQLEFFEEVDPEQSRKSLTSRHLALVLRKKEKKAEYWPRLSKQKVKSTFVKTDFSKWVDEDEQDGEPVQEDDADMMGGGMPGMGGMGGMPGLGGMGGMPGMGGMGGMPGGMDFEAVRAHASCSRWQRADGSADDEADGRRRGGHALVRRGRVVRTGRRGLGLGRRRPAAARGGVEDRGQPQTVISCTRHCAFDFAVNTHAVRPWIEFVGNRARTGDSGTGDVGAPARSHG